MRGQEKTQTSMLVLRSPADFVPKQHPIRRIKEMADEILQSLSPTLEAMYAEGGRPSIPPERLLKATILMALHTVRSERQFCEQLGYNLLFRWFLDMDMTEQGWEHSSFSRNRERLLKHDVAGKFFYAVVEQARRERLTSSEHFTVSPRFDGESQRLADGLPSRPGRRASRMAQRIDDAGASSRSLANHRSR